MDHKSLNGNQLKIIAMIAMTTDHVVWATFPGYRREWWIILLHLFGRLAAPIFWYMIAEGYHYTHNLKKYASRLFIMAIISHFAYNFAFGIPFLPFQTSIFNQTSVIWPLFWGLIACMIDDNEKIKNWQKGLLIAVITAITLCSDWSCIATYAVLNNHKYYGNLKKQMIGMMVVVSWYSIIYAIFIDPVYGILQMGVALTIPLLKMYDGTRGNIKGMKYLFYVYYPLHLVICGILRILVNDPTGMIVGGR